MALKSKEHVAQNWLNIEKRPPFLQLSLKLSEIFWVKAFGSIFFLARIQRLKNG
jgi:hypothetical protein